MYNISLDISSSVYQFDVCVGKCVHGDDREYKVIKYNYNKTGQIRMSDQNSIIVYVQHALCGSEDRQLKG